MVNEPDAWDYARIITEQEREIARLKGEVAECHDAHESNRRYTSEMERDLTRALDAARGYMHHLPDCRARRMGETVCTCGLTQLLATLAGPEVGG